ncbi:MAG TPA: GNAT family protein [Gaiellaceae bacterium]|nr:GNAT family protein [Gaiellaceae bacterium]
MSVWPTLSDGVVTLGPFLTEDVDAHVAGEDEEHARRFGWWPDRSNNSTALAAFEQWRRDWEENGATRSFATRRADTGVLVGGCQLRLREKRMAELSYWTFPSHRGRGFARCAAALVCRFAFQNLGVERIEAYVEPDNAASRRVVEGVGFREEGLVRKRELTQHGERKDMTLYGLLPADPVPSKESRGI